MKYKMAAAAVLGTLLLGGCGGSDDVIDNRRFKSQVQHICS